MIIKRDPTNWQEPLSAALRSVDWKRSNGEWQGVAMVGDRVNNTGPAIRATAGYILECAGITDGGAAPYLATLESSRAALEQ